MEMQTDSRHQFVRSAEVERATKLPSHIPYISPFLSREQTFRLAVDKVGFELASQLASPRIKEIFSMPITHIRRLIFEISVFKMPDFTSPSKVQFSAGFSRSSFLPFE